MYVAIFFHHNFTIFVYKYARKRNAVPYWEILYAFLSSADFICQNQLFEKIFRSVNPWRNDQNLIEPVLQERNSLDTDQASTFCRA